MNNYNIHMKCNDNDKPMENWRWLSDDEYICNGKLSDMQTYGECNKCNVDDRYHVPYMKHSKISQQSSSDIYDFELKAGFIHFNVNINANMPFISPLGSFVY